MDKSIFEPLSMNELKEAMGNTPQFEDLYDKIQSTNITLKETQKAKFMELTYERVLNIDTLSNYLALKQLDEWRISYKPYEQKIDSIANSWKGKNNIPECIKNYLENRYVTDGEYIIKEFINHNSKTTEEQYYELMEKLDSIDKLAHEYLNL